MKVAAEPRRPLARATPDAPRVGAPCPGPLGATTDDYATPRAASVRNPSAAAAVASQNRDSETTILEFSFPPLDEGLKLSDDAAHALLATGIDVGRPGLSPWSGGRRRAVDLATALPVRAFPGPRAPDARGRFPPGLDYDDATVHGIFAH